MKKIALRDTTLIKHIFTKHYLPFNKNEWILIIIQFMFFLGFVFLSFKTNIFWLPVIFIVELLILAFAFYKRFFQKITTNLDFKKNTILIQEILNRQKKVYVSVEKKEVYMFEVSYKRDTETIVIYCDSKAIYLNSYLNSKFYLIKSPNLTNLKKLILIKSKEQK